MLTWVNFLHLYQPPGQEPKILQQVADEGYRYLLGLFDQYPNFRATLNISGSLVEQWSEHNFTDVIEGFRRLVAAGRVELVGSAMYHPILPLLPKVEVARQITLNNEVLSKTFDPLYAPTGFYLPEMAYSERVAKVIGEHGFKWLLLDEVHAKQQPVDPTKRYRLKGSELRVVFRNRYFSNNFPPEAIFKKLPSLSGPVVTAQDGEIYGHRHRDTQGFIKQLLTSPQVEVVTVSEYLHSLTTEQTIEVRAASWESTPALLKARQPYHLWLDRRNKIHQGLYALQIHLMELLERHHQDPNFAWARRHLDRGLASCYAWWSARARPSAFSPLTWHPAQIEKGVHELLESMRSLTKLRPSTKIRIEDEGARLLRLIWRSHWLKSERSV